MTWLELIRLKRVKYKVIMRWIKGCMVSEYRKESCVCAACWLMAYEEEDTCVI
jgi:hypothetical protein